MFDTLVKSQGNNSLAADAQGLRGNTSNDQEEDFELNIGSKVTITPDLRAMIRNSSPNYPLYVPDFAHSFTHIRHHATSYSIQARHEGNSGVVFEGSHTPYQIEGILQFPSDSNEAVCQGTWIIARPHLPAQVNVDPYILYPHLRMKIWGVGLGRQIAVPISKISFQFAQRAIIWEDKQVTVVASLSRVCVVYHN